LPKENLAKEYLKILRQKSVIPTLANNYYFFVLL
jgi:hypothetical protein